MDNQQKFQKLLEDEKLQQAMKRAQDNISAILMRRFMENNGANGGNNQQLPASSSTAQTSSHFAANTIAHNSQASIPQCVSSNIQTAQASSTSDFVDSGIQILENQSHSGSFNTPSSSTQTTPSFHPSTRNFNNLSSSQAIPYFLQNNDCELAAAEIYSANFHEFPLLNARLDLNSSNSTNNTPNPICSPPIPKIRLQQRNGQWKNQKLQGWRKNPEVLKLVMAYIQWAANNPNSNGGLKMLVERIEALLNVQNLYKSVTSLVQQTRSKHNMIRHKKGASTNNQNTVQSITARNSTANSSISTNSLNSQNCDQNTQIEPIPNMTNNNLQYSGQQFQVQIIAMNSTANLFLGTTMSKNLQNFGQPLQSNARIAMNSEQLNNLVRSKNMEKSKQIGPLITIDSDDSESEASTSQATINTFSPGLAWDYNLAQLEQTISQQMNVFDQQKNIFDGQESGVEQFLSSNFEQTDTTSPRETCQNSEEVEANTSVVSNSNGSLKENNAAQIMREIQKEIQIVVESAQKEVEIEQEEQHSEAIANEVEAETETVPYFEEASKETGGEQQKTKEDALPYKIAELLIKEDKLSQNEEAEQIDNGCQNMRENNSESGEDPSQTTSNVEATIENAQNPLEHLAEEDELTAEGTRRHIKSGPQIWMRRSSHKIADHTDTKVFHRPPPVRLIPKRPKVRVIVENISTVLATIGKEKIKSENESNSNGESQEQLENSANFPLGNLQSTSNTNAPNRHQKRKCTECNIKLSHTDKWAYHLLAKHGIFVNQTKLVIDYLRGMDKKRMGRIVWRCNVCKSAKKKSDFATASQLAEHFELEKHSFNHSTKKYTIEDVLAICEGKKL